MSCKKLAEIIPFERISTQKGASRKVHLKKKLELGKIRSHRKLTPEKLKMVLYKRN